MADRDIKVRFVGDATDLERASEKAERSVGDAGKSMGAGLGALAGPAGIAATAIAGVGIAAYGMADAAMEDEAAAAQLAHQLRTAAGASDEAVAGAEAYISTLSEAAAVADDELRPALATLATATGDTAKAQDLLALATDISAGTGKDLGTVSDALAKAQLGSTGALSKLGIATKDAAGETMTLEQVLESARGKFAGAGEAAASTSSGGLKSAGIAFGELQEQIGAKLLPILGGLGTIFTDVIVPAGERLVAWVEEQWPRIMEQIGPPLEELRATAAEVFAALQAFWEEHGEDIQRFATEVLGYYVGWIATELKAFAAIVGWVIDGIRAFWARWGDEITSLVGTWIAAAGVIIDWVRRLFDVAKGVFDTLIGLAGDFANGWTILKDAVARGVDAVRDTLAGFKDRVADALRGVADVITAPFRAAFDTIQRLWDNTVGKLRLPDWIPRPGGQSVAGTAVLSPRALGTVAAVPAVDLARASTAITIVMPTGSDGYDVARQLANYNRSVGAVTTAVSIR